jgi:NAD(P)H-hydrate epimerase
MKVASAEQMKQIDRLTQEKFGVPGLVLMERAALTVLESMEVRYGDLSGKRIYICCGKGSNGGDGLALARLLTEKAAIVTVVLAFEQSLIQGQALENLKLADKFGIRLVQWPDFNPRELESADFIVDALLGTGAAGSPSGPVAEIIVAVNNSAKPVVAIDLPSGVTVDSGQVSGVAIKAVFTVTFGLPKPGLLCYPGAEYTGELIVKQVGFPQQLLENEAININLLTAPEIKHLLPQRSLMAHKGTNGHVLVIGGSPGMTGAVALASLGALRSGCGLATAGLRLDLLFLEKPTEVMVMPWPDLIHRWGNFQSIVFGPGLSKIEDGESFLIEILEHTKTPLVIDADGLNLLAGNQRWYKDLKQPIVLTPHPGEMSRLTGLSVSEIQADRIGVARRFAALWKVIIVLKGARTVIAAPDGRIFINPTGNPGMATGGTGDVLAGMIGGFIAQDLKVINAAIVGTYLHGLAGDLTALEQGPAGIIASDLIQKIPIATKKVLSL